MSKEVTCIITCDESWIYYYDVRTKSQIKIWVFEGEEHPTQTRKQVCCKENDGGFLWKTWYHQNGDAGTSKEPYSEIVHRNLPTPVVGNPLEPAAKITDGLWILHHYNVPAHRTHAATDYPKKVWIKVLSHPLYSPDLAPCDFELFPFIKMQLKGWKFATQE